jgi:hypothetical protein
LGIPLVLAIFLLQGGMLLRTLSLEAGLSKAAAVVDRCDTILSSLRQLEAAAEQTGATVGSGTANLFETADARLSGLLQLPAHTIRITATEIGDELQIEGCDVPPAANATNSCRQHCGTSVFSGS